MSNATEVAEVPTGCATPYDATARQAERLLEEDCSTDMRVISDPKGKRPAIAYLPWASAWGRVLRHDPSASYEVVQFPEGPMQRLPTGGWMVWVDVTIYGLTRRAYLPVLDHYNRPLAEPDAGAVNKSIQRCLAKGIALHGLGLYLYRGEDLPSDEYGEAVQAKVSPKQADTIRELMGKAQVDAERFLQWLKVESVEAIPAAAYDRSVDALETAARKNAQQEPAE